MYHVIDHRGRSSLGKFGPSGHVGLQVPPAPILYLELAQSQPHSAPRKPLTDYNLVSIKSGCLKMGFIKELEEDERTEAQAQETAFSTPPRSALWQS